MSYLCPKLLQQDDTGGNDTGQVNAAFSRTDSSIDISTISTQYSMVDENQEQNTDEDEHDSLTSKDMLSFSWQIAQGMVSKNYQLQLDRIFLMVQNAKLQNSVIALTLTSPLFKD